MSSATNSPPSWCQLCFGRMITRLTKTWLWWVVSLYPIYVIFSGIKAIGYCGVHLIHMVPLQKSFSWYKSKNPQLPHEMWFHTTVMGPCCNISPGGGGGGVRIVRSWRLKSLCWSLWLGPSQECFVIPLWPDVYNWTESATCQVIQLYSSIQIQIQISKIFIYTQYVFWGK